MTLRIETFATRLEALSIPEPNSGCLLWLGGLRGDYPSTSFQGKRREVHRAVLELKLGRPLLPGEQACHKCDVQLCINEDHLFPGTIQDNTRDRDQKGRTSNGAKHSAAMKRSEKFAAVMRTRRGNGNPASKITEATARLIFSATGSQHDIAEKFDVSQSLVSLIKNKRCWLVIHE